MNEYNFLKHTCSSALPIPISCPLPHWLYPCSPFVSLVPFCLPCPPLPPSFPFASLVPFVSLVPFCLPCSHWLHPCSLCIPCSRVSLVPFVSLVPIVSHLNSLLFPFVPSFPLVPIIVPLIPLCLPCSHCLPFYFTLIPFCSPYPLCFPVAFPFVPFASHFCFPCSHFPLPAFPFHVSCLWRTVRYLWHTVSCRLSVGQLIPDSCLVILIIFVHVWVIVEPFMRLMCNCVLSLG